MALVKFCSLKIVLKSVVEILKSYCISLQPKQLYVRVAFLSLRVLIFSTTHVIYRSHDITLHYNESYDIKPVI